MARACVFCKGKPVSDEHVWPRWLRKTLPSLGAPLKWEHGSRPAGEQHRTVANWDLSLLDVKVKRVCESCNTGWMSRLEATARPILEPMIRGQARLLTVDDQRILATWVTKTAMMAEFTEPKNRVIPPEDHASFYRTQEPLERSFAWLAAYDGPGLLAHRHQGRLNPTQVLTTFSLGAVIIQHYGWGSDQIESAMIADFQGELHIWPAQDEKDWPGALVLHDREAFMAYGSSIANGLRPVVPSLY